MQLTTQVVEDVGTVQVRGEVDRFVAPRLERVMQRMLRDGISQLVIDCQGIEFIDSAGLGAILQAYIRAKAQGATVTLHRPDASICRLLQVTGLDGVVSVSEPIAEPHEGVAGQGQRQVEGADEA